MSLIQKIDTPDTLSVPASGQVEIPNLDKVPPANDYVMYRFFGHTEDIELITDGDTIGLPVEAGSDILSLPHRVRTNNSYRYLTAAAPTTVNIEVAVVDGTESFQHGPITDDVDIDTIDADVTIADEYTTVAHQAISVGNSSVQALNPVTAGASGNVVETVVQNNGSTRLWVREDNTASETGTKLIPDQTLILENEVNQDGSIYVYFPDANGGQADVLYREA